MSDCNIERLENRLADISPIVVKQAVDGYIDRLVKRIFNNGFDLNVLLERTEAENIQLFNDTWEQVESRLLGPIRQLRAKHGYENTEEGNKKLQALINLKYADLNNNLKLSEERDAFLNEVSKKFKEYGIGVSFKATDEEVDKDFQEHETQGNRDGVHINPLTIDPKLFANTLVKLISGTIPEYQYNEHEQIIEKQSDLFMATFYDFDKINRFLQANAIGISNIHELFQKIDAKFLDKASNKYSEKNLWIPELKRRLNLDNDLLTRPQLNTIVSFESAYANKQVSEVIKQVLAKGSSYSTDPATTENTKRYTETWRNNIIRSLNESDEESKENFFAQTNTGLEINRSTKRDSNYQKFINTKDISKTESPTNITNLLNKLKFLGIDFKASHEDLINNPTQVKLSPERNVSILYDAYMAIAKVLESKYGKDGRYIINTFDELFYEGVTSKISNLGKVYGNLNPSEQTFSHFTPEGEIMFAMHNMNGIGTQTKQINDAQTIENLRDSRPDLVNNPYVNFSRNITLDTLFSNSGNKYIDSYYKQAVILGIGIGETEEGASTSKLEINDRKLQEINNILKDIYNFGIDADKNTDWACSLYKAYIQFSQTISSGSKLNPKLYEHWGNLLRDEMDSAWSEIYTPGHVTHFQDNVWKLAYFSDILPASLIKKFQEDVLLMRGSARPEREVRGTNDEYRTRRAKFLADNNSEINESITKHIDRVTESYIQDLITCGAIRKVGNGDKAYYAPGGIIRSALDSVFGKADLTKLTLDQVRDLSRFLQVNYEVARNEQHKFHFGHPSYYADVMKRYALFMGVKQVLSSNPVVLKYLNNLRRTDLRTDTISETNLDKYRRHVTYKEPVYVLEGHEQMAEEFYKEHIGKYSKARLEKHLGVIFTEEGKFKELLLDTKNKPQGAIGKYCGVKGADSQCYWSFDYYWSYKARLRGINKDEQKLYDYDWAYEVYTLGTATEESDKHFAYPEDWVKEAKDILDLNSWTRPTQPIETLKSSHAAFSRDAVPVTLKDSSVYTCLAIVEGTSQEDAYIAHKRLGIDSYGWESGQKTGALTEDDGKFVSYYNEEGKYGGKTPRIQYLDPLGTGEQVQSSTHDDVVGTQMTKQISSDLPEHLKPVQTELTEAMNELSRVRTRKFLDDAGIINNEDGTYSIGNATNFSNRLYESLVKSGISTNQLEAIKVTDLGDGRFHITTPFDATPIKDPVEYMIWSMINKEIINPRYFGIPAVQTPMHGRESYKEPVRFAYLNKDLKKYQYLTKEQVTEQGLNVHDLQIVQPKDTAQQRVGKKTTPYKNIIPWAFGGIKVKDEKTGEDRSIHPRDLGLTQHPGQVWKDDNGVLDPRILKTLGYRIPTPGVTGISAGEALGFFDPSMGSIMAKYSSEVAKQDDDFDYDKFNLMYVPVRLQKKDFKSDAFKEHMINHLKALGYKNAEEIFNSYTQSDIKLINESAWSETGQEHHQTATNIKELSNEDADFLANLKHIKKGIQEYNAKFKKKVLEVIDPEEKTEEGYMSKIWHKRWELMTDGDRYVKMMTPISMGTIPEDAEAIRTLLGQSNKAIKMTKNLELANSQNMRQEFVSSKFNLAPIAKAVALHSLMQQAHIYLTGHFDANKMYYFWHASGSARDKDLQKLKNYPIQIIFPHNRNEHDKITFGGITDAEGNIISQNYSSRLQSVLEVVKNPAIKDVGINSRTVGTADYLTEIGVPDKYIHYFFTQPIIKRFCEEMNSDSSMYNTMLGKRIWESGVVYKILRQYSDKSWANASFLNFKDKVDFYGALVPKLEQLNDVTIEQLEKGLINDNSSEAKLFQMQILFRFLQYKTQAGSMFSYSQYCGDDTDQIKTFDEYNLSLRKLSQVKKDNMIANPEDVDKYTFIGQIKQAKSQLNNGLKQYFVTMDERLQPLVEDYIDKLEGTFIKEDDRKDAINRYRRFITNYIIQTLPGKNNEILATRAKELLIGENSLGKQLSKLKDQYPDNLLLQNLQPLLTQIEGQADALKPLGLKNTPLELEQIIQTCLQGYKGKKIKNKPLKEFITKLAQFSLIQTGGQPNRNSIGKFLANELFTKSTLPPLNLFKEDENISINSDFLDKNFAQIYYKVDPRVIQLNNEYIDKENTDNSKESDFLPYDNPLVGNNSLKRDLLLIPKYNTKSNAEYVWRHVPTLGLTPAQKQINQRADKPELNGQDYLYQAIPGAFKEGTRFVGTGEYDKYVGKEIMKSMKVKCKVYKRVNILGKRGVSTEVNLTGYDQSMHPQNAPFNELNPAIQKEIQALIWNYGNNTVSLQGSSPENPINNIGNDEDSYPGDGGEQDMTNTSNAQVNPNFSEQVTPDNVDKLIKDNTTDLCKPQG